MLIRVSFSIAYSVFMFCCLYSVYLMVSKVDHHNKIAISLSQHWTLEGGFNISVWENRFTECVQKAKKCYINCIKCYINYLWSHFVSKKVLYKLYKVLHKLFVIPFRTSDCLSHADVLSSSHVLIPKLPRLKSKTLFYLQTCSNLFHPTNGQMSQSIDDE